MNTTLAVGDVAYRDFGALHIRIDRDQEGIAITVTAHPTLSRAFLNDDLAAARTYLRFLRDAALRGEPVWQIEAGALALINAGHALTHADAELVDAINATMDAARQAAPVDVSDMVTDRPGRSWNQMRQQARRDYSRTRVHCQDPTGPELDRMRQHEGGIVTCGPGQNWTLLRGIVRRGLAVEHEVCGRYAIRSVRLNARGYAAIAVGSVAA